MTHLTSKTVKGLSLTLESINNIHGHNSLAASVLSVSDRVADDILEEHLEDSTSLLVNETRDTLHTTTTSETADSWLGDTLNVIAENLAVTLGSSLSESFTSFSAARHDSVDMGNSFKCSCATVRNKNISNGAKKL
jgi:hypothetical protein